MPRDSFEAPGNMLVVALLIFGVTAFLSMWVSNTASAALLVTLFAAGSDAAKCDCLR